MFLANDVVILQQKTLLLKPRVLEAKLALELAGEDQNPNISIYRSCIRRKEGYSCDYDPPSQTCY